MFDRTILVLLSCCLVLLLLSIHYGMKSDRLEDELVTTKKYINKNCACK